MSYEEALSHKHLTFFILISHRNKVKKNLLYFSIAKERKGSHISIRDGKMNSTSFAKIGNIEHIVLLDDDPSVLFALRLLMKAVGYSVTDFSNPLEALNFIKSDQQSQLFVSDLRMPEMSGLKVLEKARTIRPDLPFVLMSAHATADDQTLAKRLGCFGFLSKPFTPDDLNRVILNIQLAEAV